MERSTEGEEMGSVSSAETECVSSSSSSDSEGKAKKAKLSALPQDPQLPMKECSTDFGEHFIEHETVILYGSTGCGKSTQVPQIIYEILEWMEIGSYGNMYRIAITEPRRIAAVTLAGRVQFELMSKEWSHKVVPENVGYHVRFQNETSKRTKIIFLTEGILVQESLKDPQLLKYKVIVIDEAHERSINTDLVLGIAKRGQELRRNSENPLKVVVMSATGQVQEFQDFFPNAKVLVVEGTTFPVKLNYLELGDDMDKYEDYMVNTISTIVRLHGEKPFNEHFLVFLTGQEEIETVVKILNSLDTEIPIMACPLYATISTFEQRKAFETPTAGTRKIVIATNVAETSITIEGIAVVIDCGHFKERYVIEELGLESLDIRHTSKSQAVQRAGRAGRNRPGEVYRMYSASTYEEHFSDHQVPAILRSGLSEVIMKLAVMGFEKVEDFPFITKPDNLAISHAITNLRALSLVDCVTPQHPLVLSPLGKQLIHLPVEPKLAVVLFRAAELGILNQMATIVAMLEAGNLYLSIDDREEFGEVYKEFWAPEGDFITYINIYKKFKAASWSRKWCSVKKLNYRSLKYAHQIREQLISFLERQGNFPGPPRPERINFEISKLFIKWMPNNRAQIKDGNKNRYFIDNASKTSELEVRIHPRSALYKSRPPKVAFVKLLMTETKDTCIEACCVIDESLEKEVLRG